MLAHALGRHGIETALVPLYDQAIDVPLLGLDALVINYTRPANHDLVQGYANAGLPVWVMDTEGGVLADDGANTPDRLAAYVRDSGWSKLLAGYFFWGSTLREAFVAHSGMPAAHLHATGCPRFDWAAPRWRELLQHEHHGYVLVNANFPLVNPLFVRSPEVELDALVSAGWEREYVVRLIADSRQILEAYIGTIHRLASQRPQRKFLVRPHPFENADRYRQAFAGLANVMVDGRGSVLNVIRQAQCVLHLNCGTSIEAVMLDKLPLSMEFLNTPLMSRHSTLPSRISQAVPDEASLFAILDDLDGAQQAFPFKQRYDALIAPWFHRNDGGAAERMAEVLAAALQHLPRRKPSLRQSLASSRRRSRPAQRAQAALSNLVGSRRSAQWRAMLQPARANKRLDLQTISGLVSMLDGHAKVPASLAQQAQHPVSGVALSSILISPRDR